MAWVLVMSESSIGGVCREHCLSVSEHSAMALGLRLGLGKIFEVSAVLFEGLLASRVELPSVESSGLKQESVIVVVFKTNGSC